MTRNRVSFTKGNRVRLSKLADRIVVVSLRCGCKSAFDTRLHRVNTARSSVGHEHYGLADLHAEIPGEPLTDNDVRAVSVREVLSLQVLERAAQHALPVRINSFSEK